MHDVAALDFPGGFLQALLMSSFRILLASTDVCRGSQILCKYSEVQGALSDDLPVPRHLFSCSDDVRDQAKSAAHRQRKWRLATWKVKWQT